jgi:hypothetical protein
MILKIIVGFVEWATILNRTAIRRLLDPYVVEIYSKAFNQGKMSRVNS